MKELYGGVGSETPGGDAVKHFKHLWCHTQNNDQLAVKPAFMAQKVSTVPSLLQTAAEVGQARSHCRFVLPPIHFIPDSLTCSVTQFLKRKCDRTIGPPEKRLHAGAADHHRISCLNSVGFIVSLS